MKHIIYIFIFACFFLFQQHICAMQERRLPERHVGRLARDLLDGADRYGLLDFFHAQQKEWRKFRQQDLAMSAIHKQLAEQHDLMRVWNSPSADLFRAYVDWVEGLRSIAVCKQLGCHCMQLSLVEQAEWGEQVEVVSSDEFTRRFEQRIDERAWRNIFLDEGVRLADAIIRVLGSEQ